MRKLLIVLVAVLTVLALVSCKPEPAHEHIYNDYGICLTCGDYRGTAMNRESNISYSLENFTLKTGKNYFSIAVAEDVNLDHLDFYKTHEPPFTYPTNVVRVDLYDNVRLQTLDEVSETSFEPAEAILGTDGERTVYLVVECDADETVQYICFIS